MKTFICDDGSTSTKLAWLERNKVRSVIVSNSATEGRSIAWGNQKVVETEGRVFTFAEALPNRLPTHSRNYQTSDHSRASIWHAITSEGLESKIAKEGVRAVVTLPISAFFGPNGVNEDLIEKKKQSLLKPVTINGQSFKFDEVVVYPEGLPVSYEFLYTKSGDANVDKSHKTLIVDIGGTTTDVAVVYGAAEFVDQAGSFTDISGHIIADAVKKNLSTMFDQIPPVIVDQIIETGEAMGGELTADQVGLDQCVETVGRRLVEKLIEMVGDPRTVSTVVLVGGPAVLFADIIKATFKNVKIPEGCQTRLAESILEIEQVKGAK